MRLGSENRNKTILAIALTALAIFLLVRTFGSGGGAPAAANPSAQPAPTAAKAVRGRRVIRARTPGQTAAAAEAPVSLDPRLRLDLLKASEDTEYKGAGRNIFRAEAEPVAIPKPVQPPIKSVQASPPVYTPPPPPPINLKFFGFASEPGQQKKIFLSSGEDVFVASEGEIVNRRYKVMKIGNTSVDIQDLLSNNRQTIPLTQG
jgi:hypothetical protein